MRLKSLNKITTFIATLALLINSLGAPLSVIAQEVTPDPTPVDTSTPSPDPTVVPSPTVEETATPTPEETVAPTPEVTVEPAPAAQETTSTVESTQPETQGTTNESAEPQAPPSESPTATQTSTPEASVDYGEVTTTVVENINLSTVDLLNSNVDAASVTTDKADYSPTSVVLITGTGLTPGKAYTLVISSTDQPPVTFTDSVTADSSGSFTYAYQLDGNYRPDYSVQVMDGEIVVASTTFTDSANPGVDFYSQCSNDDGDGYASGDTGCQWTNGNLQQSNSAYYEGDSTVQRLAVQHLPTGDHTIILTYATTKGGKHAYDFMTDDTFSETWVTNADICDPSLGHLASCASLTPVSSGLIPTDPNAAGHDTAVSARHFKIRNGIWVGGGILSGPMLASGSYAGDSETTIQLNFHVDASTCADPYTNGGEPVCEVLITWGAHVSKQSDWGAGTSAVNISGSPYHVALINLNGDAIGSRDNQMQASAIRGSITLDKVTDPSGDTTSFGFTTTGFSINMSPSLTDAGSPIVWSDLGSGDYSISENSQSGWTLSSKDCTGGASSVVTQTASGVSITLANGENLICTFTNTLQQAHLTVIKHVINDNGGTAVAADFTLDSGGINDIPDNFAGAESPGTDVTLDVGSYNVTETGPSGYTAGYSADCSGTIAAGETKTCTVTNDDQAATLHVVKVVINDNGGTKGFTDFSFQVDGGNAVAFEGDGQNDLTVNAGTYNITEPAVTGYTTIYNNCSNVVIPNGGSATCTITNDDIAPSLTLIKALVNDDGGNEVESSWTLTATGPTGFSGAGPSVSNGVSFDAGSYNLSESGPGGYIASGWVCVGGTQDDADTVTLGLGESAICTITNNDIPATITLTKQVINNFGGPAVAGSFTLTVDGSGVVQGTPYEVDSNTSHAIDENGLSGYEFVSIAGDTLCPGVLGGTVTLDEGQNISCIITNQDLPATLIVIKHVISDNGGTLDAGDFTMNVTGTDVSDTSFPGEESPGTAVTLDAGSYSVDEDAVSGYTKSLSTDCSGTIAVGETKSCTITNDDQAGTITIVKHVNSPSGQNFDFTGPLGAFTLDDDADPTEVNTLDFSDLSAGSYSVTEGTNTKWTLTGLICNDPNQETTIDIPGRTATIDLDLGEHITCTYTNSRRPQLKVLKHVINDNGGSASASDFTMNVTGVNATPSSLPGTESSSSYQVVLDPGAYSVSETGTSGYTETDSADCSGTLTYGDQKTCTITNDDIAPTLTLVKTVVNDNGGTKIVSDFPLFINGDPVVSGQANTLSANILYTASETGDPGYTASVWGTDCASDGTITLNPGDNKTCTITNNDKPGTLIVKKVIDGGEAVFGNFSFQVNGGEAVTFDRDGQNELTENAGFYTVTEPKVESYATSYNNCTRVQITNGGSATCTITNTWQNPQINITKSNNSGSGISAGSTVTYTLTIQNTGNVGFNNILVTDFLPGGFTYVDGSTTGDGTFVPPQIGSKLTWNIDSLLAGETATITYQASTDSSLTDGSYKNFATCLATYNEGSTLACNQTDSNVTIGHNPGFGGNLVGQVLGASTELPATGSPTALLILSLGLIGTGLFLNGYSKKKHHAKN